MTFKDRVLYHLNNQKLDEAVEISSLIKQLGNDVTRQKILDFIKQKKFMNLGPQEGVANKQVPMSKDDAYKAIKAGLGQTPVSDALLATVLSYYYKC